MYTRFVHYKISREIPQKDQRESERERVKKLMSFSVNVCNTDAHILIYNTITLCTPHWAYFLNILYHEYTTHS